MKICLIGSIKTHFTGHQIHNGIDRLAKNRPIQQLSPVTCLTHMKHETKSIKKTSKTNAVTKQGQGGGVRRKRFTFYYVHLDQRVV